MSRMRQRSQDAPVTLLPFLAVLICTMGALIVLLVVVVQQARVQGTETVGASEPPVTPTVAVIDSAPPNAPTGEQKITTPPPLTPVGPSPDEVRQAQQERDKYLWEIEMLAASREKTQQRLGEKRLELSHLEEHSRRLSKQLEQLGRDLQQTKQDQADYPAADMPAAELAVIEQQIATKNQQLVAARKQAASRRGTYQLIPYFGARGTTRRPIYIECLADGVIIQPDGVRLGGDDFEMARSAGNPLAAALRAVREYWLKTAGESERGEPYPLLVVRPGGETAYAACRQALGSWDDEFGYELIPQDVKLSYPPADAQLTAEIEQAVRLSRQQQQRMKGFLALHDSGGPVYRASRREGGFVREGRSSKSKAQSNSKATFPSTKTVEPPGNASSASRPLAGPNSATRPAGRARDASLDGNDTNDNAANDNPANNERSSGFQPSRATDPSFQSVAAPPSAVSPEGHHGTPSLAEARGPDWALPNAARGAIPIRRPLYVSVNKHQLVLEPESGTSQSPRVIAFGASTVDAVQTMVTSIWQRIEDWGVAGPGVYWKPAMEVAVAPDGESRFQELASLLEDSGIELQRR